MISLSLSSSSSLPTDMAVPALARFGSDHLKEMFLAPTIAGDVVVCLGVSEAGAGSDVASIKTTAKPKNGETSLSITELGSILLDLYLWREVRVRGCRRKQQGR